MMGCSCKFIMVGLPMTNEGCTIHDQLEYKCDECECLNYRPRREPKHNTDWPLCVCGHPAQHHK